MHGETAKKKKERVVLSEAARYVFQQLKKAVMSTLVLAYPDPSKEYLLETDASKLGLGAVLSQKQSDRRYHPIAFGSRALHGVEVNYHSTKLEFLAMKWSIEHFWTYLLGHHFKVHMDNNPLTYFLTSPNIVRHNLAVHGSVTPFIIWQPIWRPRLLERVYKPMHTSH